MVNADKFIQDIARQAGKLVKAEFGRAQVVKAKRDPTDVFTQADLASERLIISAIKKKFPSHGIIAEENGTYHKDAEYVWYIDPIDGTFNFSRGNPNFCVMIGVARRGVALAGAIYLPMLDWMYFASAGKGAYLNGRRIHGSKTKMWKDSYGCATSNMRRPEKIAFMEKLLIKARDYPFWLGAMGSFGVAAGYVAQGVFDWWASIHCNPWETTSAGLILKEAGCVVTNKAGRSFKVGDESLVVANQYLHPQLIKLVREK